MVEKKTVSKDTKVGEPNEKAGTKIESEPFTQTALENKDAKENVANGQIDNVSRMDSLYGEDNTGPGNSGSGADNGPTNSLDNGPGDQGDGSYGNLSNMAPPVDAPASQRDAQKDRQLTDRTIHLTPAPQVTMATLQAIQGPVYQSCFQ